MTRVRGAGVALLVAAAGLSLGGCPHPVAPLRTLGTLHAEDLPADPKLLEAQADALYVKADPSSLEDALAVLGKWRTVEPRSLMPIWEGARAAFWIADQADARNEPSRHRRGHFADLGVQLARTMVKLAPDRVEGHYYLALCLGYAASTKNLGALPMLPEIVREAKRAAELDERFDHGGPRRLLGAVFARAPGWPTSVGDADEAIQQLEKALAIDASFPPNLAYYAEALVAGDRCADASKQIADALALPPPTDPPWARQAPEWRAGAEELARKIHAKCPAAHAMVAPLN